ncbi:MAG TPA: branched-chain amino acid ABC transporter permease [Candidatus Sulfomarinibacteraceae bacterium]|nr:branched-chain amino acid ABC transporter permease [Candidatus Sulfomarinibacteraceae bacterium]
MADKLPGPPTIRRFSLRRALPLIIIVLLLAALPFVVGLFYGQTPGSVLANEAGNARFIMGLMIEVFILAVFAISYDLILGITGLLSLGHAMFFAVGAYLTGIMLKSFGWGLPATIGVVIIAGVLQALLFGIVLPRVRGITFALVTLGFASVFDIVIKTRELADYTGADVGLQGIPRPDYLNPNDRIQFYFVALAFALVVYLLFRRFVDSPTGRVCIAIRENEDRAQMLGYNTFYFKLAALTVSAITAGLAGTLQALYRPIVSPEIASVFFTVDGLLMILIGGMGTLSGAMVGAGVFRLMDFYLDRWFGEAGTLLIGAFYVALVLFVPYGIVGTWRARKQTVHKWRDRLGAFLTREKPEEASASLE